MGLPLFPAPRLGTLPFRVANLATLLEDLLHEIISSKDSARAAPILSTSRPGVIGKQGADLSLQCCNSFFNRSSWHDWTPASKQWAMGIVLIVASTAT
jgi:hypothetical protein